MLSADVTWPKGSENPTFPFPRQLFASRQTRIPLPSLSSPPHPIFPVTGEPRGKVFWQSKGASEGFPKIAREVMRIPRITSSWSCRSQQSSGLITFLATAERGHGASSPPRVPVAAPG